MSENNLFQFAQVIAELPIEQQNTSQNNSHHQQPPSNYHTRYLSIRKNACVVCSVCFTCSKYYGIDCTCQEVQPRRGKNLPEGGLDSRAKKLHREDGDDFEFSIKWINENAHNMYKDENDTVLGLRDLSEVSLCKAHSSTLYRAKKRHERSKDLVLHHQPPSPADSSISDHNNYTNNNNNNNNNNNPYPMGQHHSSTITSGGLAAKVREISSSQQYHQPQVLRMHDVPDFSRMSHSTSVKRKRTFNKPTHKSPKVEQSHNNRPSSSISTPLFASNSRMGSANTTNNQFMQTPPPPPPPLFNSSVSTNLPMSQEFHQHVQQVHNQQVHNQQVHMQQQQHQQQQIVDNFPSQLPPLHSRSHSISSSLPSVPQQQQQQSTSTMQLYHSHHHNTNNTENARVNMNNVNHSTPPSSSPVIDAMEISPTPSSSQQVPMVIETVSLKSSNDSMYYFRNLAITDNFTFRDLLAEIDMTGSPPAGKRIVISDTEKFYPLDQAIRSVIRRPKSTHLELSLGLTDKPSINWNTYS